MAQPALRHKNPDPAGDQPCATDRRRDGLWLKLIEQARDNCIGGLDEPFMFGLANTRFNNQQIRDSQKQCDEAQQCHDSAYFFDADRRKAEERNDRYGPCNQNAYPPPPNP